MKYLLLMSVLFSSLAFADIEQFSSDHLLRIKHAVAQKCGDRTPLKLVSVATESSEEETVFDSVFMTREHRVKVMSLVSDVFDLRTQDFGIIEILDVRCERL